VPECRHRDDGDGKGDREREDGGTSMHDVVDASHRFVAYARDERTPPATSNTAKPMTSRVV
jgi:hypothetical protein